MEKLDGKAIGIRIKTIREQVDMTQEEFAEVLEISPSEVKNIEYDKLKAIDKKRPLFKLICWEFGVSRDWLLYGEGDMLLSDDAVDLFTENIRATKNEATLLKSLMDIPPDDREQLYKYLIALFKPLTEKD